MGAVYLARQSSLNRDVALKVMATQWARDPTFLARFTREAYAAAQLVHHNIVQIYDFGAEKDVNYFSMEYVEGQTLAELIQTEGVVPPEVAVSHILQACRGLKVAHDHGMIHRDIKPENLMLNRYGIVKLADLGLVKVAGGEAAASPTAAGGTPPTGMPECDRMSLAFVWRWGPRPTWPPSRPRMPPTSAGGPTSTHSAARCTPWSPDDRRFRARPLWSS
jgi:serine/threonine protein kinase